MKTKQWKRDVTTYLSSQHVFLKSGDFFRGLSKNMLRGEMLTKQHDILVHMFKKIPLEVYFLFLPACLVFILPLFLKSSFPTQVVASGTVNTNHSVGPSIHLSIWVLSIFSIYLLCTLAVLVYKKYSPKYVKSEQGQELKKFLQSLSFLLICVNSIIITVVGLTSLMFAHASPHNIIPVGSALMSIDYSLFHTYSGVILQKFFSNDRVWMAIIYCYKYLFFAMVAILLIAFVKNVRIFRLGLLSLAFAFCISIPLWLLNPTLPPLNMYVGAHPYDPQSTYTKDLSQYTMNPRLVDQMTPLQQLWVSDTNSWYGISTNPSSHITWGLIVVVIAFLVWTPLGVVACVWFLGDALGTLLLFQHYFIDLVVGAIVAFFSLWVISTLLEKTEQIEELFHIHVKINSHIQAVRNRFVKK